VACLCGFEEEGGLREVLGWEFCMRDQDMLETENSRERNDYKRE